MGSSAPAPQLAYEMASVLFMDIVGYSLLPMERQAELLTLLQRIVRESSQFQQAHSRSELLSLPTGDGMALVFFRDPVAPVKTALEISSSLKQHPELRLRMGVHTGPVCRHADIKNEANVVGGGINIAQRVMDCGDAGHILLSRTIAEVLEQMDGWRECLQDLGTHEVKHGVRVQLYNLRQGALGNSAIPHKICDASVAGRTPSTGRTGRSAWVRWTVPSVALVIVLAAAAALYDRKAVVPNRPEAAQPTPATGESGERTFRYYFIVQKYRGGRPYQKPFLCSGDRVFEADYRIRLVFSSPQAGYLYILNEGPNSNTQHLDLNALYPSAATKDGTAFVSADEELHVPEAGPFVFDRQKGMEKLWLVWSKESLPEFEALRKWVNSKDHGAIGDPVQLQSIKSFLTQHAALQAKMEQDEQTPVTTLTVKGNILAHLIKLEHE